MASMSKPEDPHLCLGDLTQGEFHFGQPCELNIGSRDTYREYHEMHVSLGATLKPKTVNP